jgi:hypothetical protein
MELVLGAISEVSRCRPGGGLIQSLDPRREQTMGNSSLGAALPQFL